MAAAQIINVLTSLIWATGLAAPGLPEKPSEAEIRAKVTQRIPYSQFEEEVHFTVAKGEAVLLQCPSNPYGLEDFLIYLERPNAAGPDGEGLICYACCGSVQRKALSYKGRPKKGSIDQIGTAPCLAITRWTAQGEGLKIDFCITRDKAKIAKAIERNSVTERFQWSAEIRTNLLPPAEIPETDRIAGFVRLWSEVKYNFAFFDKVADLNWEKVLSEYLPRVQQAKTAPQYYRVLQECMALLHDGHTEVWGPSDQPTAAPPVRLAPIEGKAVIVAVAAADQIRDAAQRNEMAAASLKPGDEVLRIDGESVEQILRTKVYPFICASTPQSRDLKAVPGLLKGEPGSIARLNVRSLDGQERELALTRAYDRIDVPRLAHPDGDLGDGLFYVALDSFGSKDVVRRFRSHLPKIRQARGLLLDVRNNGGGSTDNGAAIIRHLIDRPLQGSHWKTRMYRPAFRAWGRPEEWFEGDHDRVEPAKDAFLGPVVVLMNPATASAAEDFLVVLKAGKRAKLVGERSCGSTGQPLMIDKLPGGGGARICTKRDTFPDGTEFVGVGVIPDVEVHPTAADIAAGRDRVLQEGVAILKKMVDQEQGRQRPRGQVLEWDEAGTSEPIRTIMPGRDDPDLTTLRTKYELEKVVGGGGDDYDRLSRLTQWANSRFKHDGDNTPSQGDPLTILAEAAAGKRFRCVEYALVTAGCAQALGVPARVVGLKRQDVETAASDAGHVVAEVWLDSRKKWVFVDAQWDAIPEKDGLPLNAVEFQEALARNKPGLKIRSSSKMNAPTYFQWIAPYLYYFDFNINQHLFGPASDHSTFENRYQPKGGKIMLVPRGAKQPRIFQRNTPIGACRYIASPKAFYAAPSGATSRPGGAP